MENLIFDSHAHYDDHKYDDDRKELLDGLKSNGVGYVLNASANIADLTHILKMADTYGFLFAASGIHPTEIMDLENETETAKEAVSAFNAAYGESLGMAKSSWDMVSLALKHPKVKVIGEIGLDYYGEVPDKDIQKKWFVRQIALAKDSGYPIIVHSREAAADTIDIIIAENARDAGGVIHCFSYEKEMAARYLDMGFYIGIGGVLTFKNARKLKEVAAYAPLDRILLETDCPYLAPAPHRGERNNSALLSFVVAELSQIKGIPEDEVIRVTADNACKLYRIS